MVEIEDWLQDPLRIIEGGSYKSRKLKSHNEQQGDLWRTFHFATRLKLEGADFFCRQVLGAASMPNDLGLPLLAHRLTEWYLDAFFFELMAANETLLQELNIVYAYDLGLKPEDIRWNDKNKNKFMKMLPEEIYNHIKTERMKDWFCKVQSYRNTATHHYTVPLSSGQVFWGTPINYVKHDVSMHYVDKAGKSKREDISECINCLKEMVGFISSVWGKMAPEFEQAVIIKESQREAKPLL